MQVFLTADYLAIAMEYASGGDLFSLVGQSKGLSEADARWYFQQLVVSVDYCHRMVGLLISVNNPCASVMAMAWSRQAC